jgi:hypothetical protein
MNIKRAFLTAVALLMLPGFALAQLTVRFDTSLQLVPAGPYTQTIDVELVCNTGNPLQQDFEIGPTTEDKVIFVVDNFDLDEFISCEITPSSLTGFEVVDIQTNGVATEDGTCLWTADDQNLSVEEDNYCRFVMAPEAFTYVVEKEFDFADDVDVSQAFSIHWECSDVLTSTYDGLTDVSGYFNGYGDSTFSVTTLRPNPWAGEEGDATNCSANEDAYDSAVESDQGCDISTTFAVGDGEKGCTIVNSVFFEGIPTLSQYGLAVMALLMLGVGFVGFRRFV